MVKSRDLKHSHTVFGISKVGQKIAISVECLGPELESGQKETPSGHSRQSGG